MSTQSSNNPCSARKHYLPTRVAADRPGRMQRLNSHLREDPEFAAQWAADRAARMKVINSKSLRKTALELEQISAARQEAEDETQRIDDTYVLDCPEGTWRGRLEEIVRRPRIGLLLCFTDTETGKQYRLPRSSGTRYMPLDGSHDFQHDAAPGDVFDLITKKTKNGWPDLKSAFKIIPGTEDNGKLIECRWTIFRWRSSEKIYPRTIEQKVPQIGDILVICGMTCKVTAKVTPADDLKPPVRFVAKEF